MWLAGDIVGDAEKRGKIGFTGVKSGIKTYHCLVSKNTWFRFFQRSGAKICIKHQMSFLGVLEGWAKSDSRVILKTSQKIALEELKQSESCI